MKQCKIRPPSTETMNDKTKQLTSVFTFHFNLQYKQNLAFTYSPRWQILLTIYQFFTIFHQFLSFYINCWPCCCSLFLIVVAFNVPTNDMFVLAMAVCEISQLASYYLLEGLCKICLQWDFHLFQSNCFILFLTRS